MVITESVRVTILTQKNNRVPHVYELFYTLCLLPNNYIYEICQIIRLFFRFEYFDVPVIDHLLNSNDDVVLFLNKKIEYPTTNLIYIYRGISTGRYR